MSLGFGLYACEREVDKTTKTTEKPRAAAEQPAAAPKPAEEPATMPAIAQPEGKGFEGRISMKMAGDRPATVEYAAKGDKVKLTIERAPGDVGEEVAAIIDRSDNKVTLLSEDAKKYAEVDLDKAYERARELASKVTLEKTGEKRTISGVECDNWKLTDGERKVTACVAKGPAYFDPAALENAAGLELPAWVERIVREGYFPLGVTITDAAGKKLTAGEVTKWTEGPVEPGDVAVPKDYQKVDRSELRSRAKEAVEERMP